MIKNMKIGKKLILTFIIVTIISGIGGIIGLIQMVKMNTSYSNTLTNYGLSQGDVGHLSAEFNNNRAVIRSLIIETDAKNMQTWSDKLKKSDTDMQQYLAKVQKSLTNKTETDYYNTIKVNLTQYIELTQRVSALALQNKKTEAYTTLINEGTTMLNSAMTAINALFDEKTNVGEQLAGDLTTQGNTMGIIIVVIIMISFILSIFIAIKIAKGISKPIKQMADAAEKMAQGDLNVQISVNSQDEIGQLGTAFAENAASIKAYIADITMNLGKLEHGDLTVTTDLDYKLDYMPLKDSFFGILASLNDAIGQISQSSDQVSCGSDQVSSAAQALAQGATEQASSVQELAATIAEISENVKTNAEHAANASINANHVRSEIESSNEHMENMVAAMSQINNSSSEIGKIIKTIEDIAFQTNILALNAAVEAARAGEAGKGFAVVADEVRNLASKSAEAAKDTTSLIENSMKQVENGTKIADETAKALLEVVENIKVVSTTVEQISKASIQQSDAINQVTLGVEQISSVVQTNSATAEESAAASEELSGQAQTMKSLVGRFKLKDQISIGQNKNNQFKPQKLKVNLETSETYSDNSKY